MPSPLVASGASQAVLPTGGFVAAGQASISQTGNVMTVDEASDRAAINWATFSIGQAGTVNFVQPSTSAIVLNRIVGQDPTQIFGALHANGEVFILNPNGVLFAPGAEVSAAGVVAATGNMSDADFMANRIDINGASSASVVNAGHISVQNGGYVALVGATVVNSGAISAPLGEAQLVAADEVSLKIDHGGLLGLSVTRGALAALAANNGLIQADGGRVYLTAEALDELSKAVVNNRGLIEARTVGDHAGRIVLMGDMAGGTTLVGGTLDASAPAGGDGGFVESSAAHVQVENGATITTSSARGKAGTWLIDPNDFTIAASGGDITGAQLGSALGTGNVLIQSTSGATAGVGDVNVNDNVSWSANMLTLNAQRNINVNAFLNGTGSAQLALQYGQGAVAAGNTSGYFIAPNKEITLPTGNNFSTQLGSDGALTSYYVINSLGTAGSTTGTDLQGIAGQLNGNFALGSDIVASPTSGWNSGAGFVPIGTTTTPFTGNFAGLGHSVSFLVENYPSSNNVGLFGSIAAGSTISNLTVANSTFNGVNNVGAVVGNNQGALVNVIAVNGSIGGVNNIGGVAGLSSGSVVGAKSSAGVDGVNSVGGLIGSNSGTVVGASSSASVMVEGNMGGGLIGDNSVALSGLSSSASVTASTGSLEIGGLIGHTSGDVTSSSATGSVAGPGVQVGGLIGATSANVINSSASTAVHGASIVGGLIGQTASTSTVSGSSASGAINASADQVGGLIGLNAGAVTNDSTTSAQSINGFNKVGGLIGENSGAVLNSSSASLVNCYANDCGGLIGLNDAGAPVSNGSATGAVGGLINVGGLIGYNTQSNIDSSYATGAVNGISNSGGLIGTSVGSAVTNSYATGATTAESTVAGGLIGSNSNYSVAQPASIANSHASGTVDAQGSAGGLVGYSEGSVNNAYATGTVVSTATIAGGLVGENHGSIVNSYASTGSVTGTSDVGGLVGTLDAAASITAGSYAAGAVTGTSIVGGLVGLNTGGTLANVSATGAVHNTGISTGGLIGVNQDNGSNTASITNAMASGAVHGANETGGLIGTNTSVLNSLTATNSVTGSSYVGGLVGRSSVNITGSSASGNVSGASDLGGLVGIESAGILSADVASGAVTGTANIVGGLVGETGGTVTGSHAGTAAISGVNKVGGLVGQMDSGASIAGGSYAGGAVQATSQAGGLVGYVVAGSITNATASGSVNATTQAGGLVGYAAAGTITNATSSGAVQGTSVLGGLVGENYANITGSQTTTAGTVTATATSSSNDVGGLIGTNHAGSTITFSTANGSVSGYSYVGGFIGNNLGTVTDSTANGNVTGSINGSNDGGFAGYQDVTALQRVTSTGTVHGGTNTGGLVGYNAGSISYGTVSGTNTVTGGSNTGGFVGYSYGSIDHSSTTHAVSGTYYVGGFMGVNHTTSVTYSSASGAVNGIYAVGGFVGVDYSPISNSSASGNVHGTSTDTGGFAAYVDYSVPLTSDTASGNVSGSVSTGGLVGENHSVISNCSATGNVTSSTNYAGGLVGSNGANITNSTATGTVVGVNDVGGLVGATTASSVAISSSSASGTATGNLDVGGLVGYNISSIVSSTASGAASGTGTVGGLVGYNANTASLSLATASGSVTSTGASAGGLVGDNFSTNTAGSTASGAVSGTTSVGGLIGTNEAGAVITQSHSTGNVSGMNNVGGFVGANKATLNGNATTGVSGTGSVTATGNDVGGFAGLNNGTLLQVSAGNSVTTTNQGQNIGGVVGLNAAVQSGSTYGGGVVQQSRGLNVVLADGTDVGGVAGQSTVGSVVTTSYAAGSVTGGSAVGGLIGRDGGSTSIAYSSAPVVGNSTVGGLIGQQDSTGHATNVYASGSVNGASVVGGLIGAATGTVQFAYADGAVTATAQAGGFTGTASGATIGSSYYNATATTQAHSISDFANTGEVASAETTAQIDSSVTFAGWNLTSSGAHNTTWRSYEGLAAPLLTYWLTPLTITANGPAATRVYDGAVDTTAVGPLSYTETLPTGHLFGVPSYTTGKNVGYYTALGGQYSDQQGYDIAYVNNGSLTITPAPLTVTLTGVTKLYDGTTLATLSSGDFLISGFVTGEGANITTTAGSYNSKDVNNATSVSATLAAGDYSAAAGTLLSNYLLPTSVTGNASISPKPLTVSAVGLDKVYDGTTTDQATLAVSGVITGDSVAISGNAAFADKNVGTGKLVTVSALTTTGPDASDYIAATPSLQTTATITPKVINVTATGTNKVYDGSVLDAPQLISSGVIVGDSISFAANSTFADKNVGNGKTVDVVGITGVGADAGNYVIANTAATTTADITPKPITVQATGIGKVYDGSSAGSATLASSGVLAGDDVLLSGAASFANKNAGVDKTLTVTGIADSGSDASNYLLTSNTAETTATITPKQITVTATGTDRIYDGTVSDAVSVTANGGVVAGDSIEFAGAGVLNNRNVGTDKPVTVSDITAKGADAGNYSFNATATTTATITPRSLTVSLTGSTTELNDGSSKAALAGDNFLVGNVAPGDQIKVTQTQGEFANTTPGSGKTVSADIATDDYAASGGTLLSNYVLYTGTVSGPIGTIFSSATSAAMLSALVSLPSDPSGASQVLPNEASAGTIDDRTGAPAGVDLLAQAVASAVSGNTRDNLKYRRTFSIGDGGIRLPAGVRGSDKDAAQ